MFEISLLTLYRSFPNETHHLITIENTIVKFYISNIKFFQRNKQIRENAISIKIDIYELVCHIQYQIFCTSRGIIYFK